jgi:hypothetical protein
MLGILLKQYDTEFMDWEPETLFSQIHDDFKVTVPDINRDKILGMITALQTDAFYTNPLVFSNVCRALDNEEADFEELLPISPEAMAWGVAEIISSDVPTEQLQLEFSPDVAKFAGIMLAEHGVYVPPKVLGFAEYSTTNPALNADSAFTDDPGMFEAVFAKQKLDSAEVDKHVVENMKKLKAQLLTLKLVTQQTTP